MKRLLSVLCSSLCLTLGAIAAEALPLSPGDRIQVSIPDEKYFAGTYEVNEKGNLEIPYVGEISVVGLEPANVSAILKEVLIEEGYFLAHNLQLSVEVMLWAPISVGISGDVYNPGTATINEVAEDYAKTGIVPETQQITGDFSPRRYLTDAIKASGGVMPTADIKHIQLVRGTERYEFDLTGVFTGQPVRDVPLISGDQIIVPVSTRYNPELVRPSAITPPGIKVVVSNLIVPAVNNAGASNSNRSEGQTFAYGARFSHAVFSMNCVGGTKATNARRRAVLVRTDRISGETIAYEKSIEDLIRNSTSDRDNPFLMRNDSVACYDSTVINVKDVFSILSDVINPFDLIKKVFF